MGKVECTDVIEHLFDADRIVASFSSMRRLFPASDVPRGTGGVSPLATGAALSLDASAQNWITQQAVTSFLVLKSGQIVQEGYYLGTGPEDLRMSWSVAKSVLATLFGILFEDGAFDSLDDPAVRYAPALKGSAYDGVTLQHLLNMASGVVFNEEYLDPGSDIRRMGRFLGQGGAMDRYAQERMDRHAAPGASFVYNSVDTHVLGMVIRGATGCNITGLLSERLIQPLGLEAAPHYVTDAHGTAIVLGGLNLRSRDYARFGQMIAQGGAWQGQQIVPIDWIECLNTPAQISPDDGLGYGDQWWMAADPRPGEFMACGIYGQYIYINRPARTVCVATSANRRFSEDGVFDQAVATFRRMADA